MADGISVGSVTVTVVPVVKGIEADLRQKTVPAASKVGDELGNALGDKVASGVGDGVQKGVGDGGTKAQAPAKTVGEQHVQDQPQRVELAGREHLVVRPRGRGRIRAAALPGEDVGGDRVAQRGHGRGLRWQVPVDHAQFPPGQRAAGAPQVAQALAAVDQVGFESLAVRP